MPKTISQDRLLDVLIYDPATGAFTWRVRTGAAQAGREAGAINKHGYRVIRIDTVLYYAHRLAWQIVHGAPPSKKIDHVNGDPADNRICNLRDVPQGRNCLNRGKASNNTSGYKGVCRSGSKWEASLNVDRKRFRLGLFKDPKDAHEAYCAAAERHGHGFVRTK